ncbi:MAG TPA: methyltransferase domain-containing protein [Planctomycetota bacterium]|nr:methyltransferase domain-containing protein [Planctomycetota bacterium]
MAADRSVEFFEAQFRRQIAANEFALNGFELAALDFTRGRVLDFGCGLGNLSIEAARRGAAVVAVDASPTATRRIRELAARDHLHLDTICADGKTHVIHGEHDTVIAIGLLMFFERRTAVEILGRLAKAVAPAGRLIVNVLVEGTTFMAMFDPEEHYLFRLGELEELLPGWKILLRRDERFEAPGNTQKVFTTIVAERQHA